MASGHVNRTNRPNTWLHRPSLDVNTWLHRPSLRREDSPCQPGAVHTWHLSDLRWCPLSRCSQRRSGHRRFQCGPSGWLASRLASFQPSAFSNGGL